MKPSSLTASPERARAASRTPGAAGGWFALLLVLALAVSVTAAAFHHHPGASGSHDFRCGLCVLAHGGALAAEPADAGLPPPAPIQRAPAERPSIATALVGAAAHSTRAPPSNPASC